MDKAISEYLAEKSGGIAEEIVSLFEEWEGSEAAELISEVSIDFTSLADDVVDYLTKAAKIGAGEVVAQIRIDDKGATDLAFTAAEDYARDRAAEMVGMKWVDGELVENPNAEWAITDSTREELSALVQDAIDNGIGAKELAANIEDSTAFSPERAEMIARTEIINAYEGGGRATANSAAEMGLDIVKYWLTSGEGESVCDICQENEDAGTIELDDEFPSGEQFPPAHPRCECVVVYQEREAGDESV
jgi:citrate lyase gamma subunit